MIFDIKKVQFWKLAIRWQRQAKHPGTLIIGEAGWPFEKWAAEGVATKVNDFYLGIRQRYLNCKKATSKPNTTYLLD